MMTVYTNGRIIQASLCESWYYWNCSLWKIL